MKSADVIYKGYVLHPVPYPRPNKKWSMDVCIMKDIHSKTRTRTFYSSTLWDTKEEADAHSIAFGRQIVDGEVEGVTIRW